MALVAPAQGAVVINEILYRPGTAYPEDVGNEWVELRNTGGASVDVGGWQFNKGVNFTFATGTTIPANGYLIVAADTVKFHAAFPSVTNYFGPWTGSLSNSSDTLRLVDAFNVTVDEVTYYNEGDWATRIRETTYNGWTWASSNGKSIELRNPTLPHTIGQNWGLSTASVGTPGAANNLAATNLAPLITNVTHLPAIPKSTEAVTISCQLTDELAPSSPSLTVSLKWRNDATDPAGTFQTVAMTNDGTGKFSATLTAKANLTIVEFYVSASDGTNTRTWPAPTSEGQNANCQYQVDDTVSTLYTATRTSADIILTRNAAIANDATLNISLANGTCAGIVAAPTSVNTTAGGSVSQVETATAVGTITTSGNATVVVTGAGIAGSPVTLSVPVLSGDTPAQWAEKVTAAINANSAITDTNGYYRMILTAAENAAFVAVDQNSNREFNQTLVVARGAERIIRYNGAMRIRGNSSRGYQFKPLRISWPGDSLWEGVSSFNCNPKASHLQYVGMSLFQSAGILAPSGYPIELRRNGVEYTTDTGATPDFGKWVRLEVVDGDFLKAHLPSSDSGGGLYSIRRDPPGEFYWRTGAAVPTNPNGFLNNCSKQNHSDANDWSDMVSFFSTWQAAAAPHFTGGNSQSGDVQSGTWNNTPFNSAEITSVSNVADLDQWAKWFAMQTIMVNRETGVPNGIDDDHDAYFIPTTTGQRRYQFIPHDLDTIFGLGDSPIAYNGVGLFDMTDEGSVFKPLLPLFGNNTSTGDDAFRTKYYLALQDLYGTVMNADTTGNPNPALYVTFDSLLTGWAPAATITTMKDFARQRQAYLLGLINSPFWSQRGGTVAAGSTFTISLRPGKTGIIKYTLDGTDPKTSGTAITYSGPITISGSVTINVRILDGSSWGALDRATFYVTQDFSKLAVTEINYNPPALGAVAGDEVEFLELKNTGNVSLDLGGLTFTNGITYTFPNSTNLAPGGFFILVRDVTAGQANFHARYPNVPVHGIYADKLSNSGETITLKTPAGQTVFSITYDDVSPWPLAADGSGFTAVPKTNIYNSDNGVNWRASANIFGSPNADDPAVTTNVVINEVLTNSGPGFLDTIELYNPTNASVNIGDWYLTDDANTPKKFRIPANTLIPAGGYALFDETQFNPATPPPGNTKFALNSAGDEVYIFAGDAAGNLTGYIHGFSFAGAELNVSFGRIVTSDGNEYFPRQASNTFGTVNSGPKVGPLVINEIMYRPIAGYDEFIEIRNISNAAVPLYDPANPANTWKVTGIGYTFAGSQSIPAGGYALIVAMDPATFRTKYNVPISVHIFGPYTGSLQDNGERISLEMPDTPVVNVVNGQNVTVVPYDVIDTVRYSNLAPWPTAADGTGPSLQRTSSSAYGDDPANWTANGLSGGFPNGTNLLPSVSIAAPATNSPYTAPAIVTFTSNVSDADGSVIKVEYFSGATKLGESSVAPNFSFDWTSTVGTHTITAKATDNSLGFATSAPITVYITTAVTQGLKGDYYGNKTLTAPIAGTRTDSTINFSTASASWPTAFGFPGLTVNTNFSTRWIGQIRATKTGIHKFTTTSNDGIRLYVGGNLVVNSWADTATGAAQVETATAAGTITNSGNATVIVTGAGITGSPLTLSVAVLSGDTPAQWAEKVRTAISGNSAITALYTATRSNADIILTRNIATTHDGTLNISLDNGTCAGIITATTSATTTTGTSTTTSTTSSDVYLNIGQLYDITIEYYQNATDGSVKLEWASSAASSSDSAIFKTTVPQTVLYPDSVPIIVRHPAGMAQTETLNVTAGSGATGNGNLSVTVTSALIPTTVVAVPVTTALNTAALVASAIVTSLNSDPTVSAKFTASNVNAAITLTTKTAYVGAYDSTLNVAIAANSLGVTAVNPSIDGAGVAVTSLSKDQGQSATFTALASGHGLTYQWRKNGQFISGATSQTYTIPYCMPGDAAQYSVFVSNSYGFAISNNAQLTVTYTDSDSDGIQDWWETANGLNPTYTADGGYDNDNDGATNLQEFLAGTNPNDPNSKFIVSIFNYTLTFTAQPYKSYSIQYKNSLTDVNWTTLQSYPANTIQQTINYTDTSHPPNARFYRVVTP